MRTRYVATVLGGTGFLGRYVVKELAEQGYVVRVVSRRPARANVLRPLGRVGQIVPLYGDVCKEKVLVRALEGADVVVNLVGITKETGANTYQNVHVEGAGRVARLAAAAGVARLLHVSVLGASKDSRDPFLRSRGEGEIAVASSFPAVTILRSAVMFGPEDRFLNLFGRLAQYFFAVPAIGSERKFQPTYVGDVSRAVMAGLLRPDTTGQLYELGGGRARTGRELLNYVLETTHRHKPVVAAPHGLLRWVAAVLQYCPFTIMRPEQLLMLSFDQVLSGRFPGYDALGITETPMDMVAPAYLSLYVPGGGRRKPREVGAV